MSRTFVHVGLHKTGTTTLQNALVQSRDALQRQGVVYPDYPGCEYAGHHYLACQLSRSRHSGGPNDMFLIERESFSERTNARRTGPTPFEALWGRRGARMILSSEIFCTFDTNELSTLTDYLGDDARLIVYYRSGIRFVHSCWATKIRWGSNQDFVDFLQQTLRGEPGTPLIGGVRFVRLLLDALGETRVSVRDFDEAIRHPRGIPGDFLEEELQLDPVPSRGEVINASPSYVDLELFRALRHHITQSGGGRKFGYGLFNRVVQLRDGALLRDQLRETVEAASGRISIATTTVPSSFMRSDGTLAIADEAAAQRLQGWKLDPNESVKYVSAGDLLDRLGR